MECSWLTGAGMTIQDNLFIDYLVKVTQFTYRLLRKLVLCMVSLFLQINGFRKHRLILLIKYFLLDAL